MLLHSGEDSALSCNAMVELGTITEGLESPLLGLIDNRTLVLYLITINFEH